MATAQQLLIPADLLAECEALALLLAPELSEAPLYAMGVPSGFANTGNCSAFTPKGAAHFDLRDALIAGGRWRGPGNIVVFCTLDTRDNMLGTMLHETAHLLPFEQPEVERSPEPNEREAQRELVVSKLSGPLGDSKSLPGWFGSHGWAFIRTCLHLHHRAWRDGYEIGLPEISCAGWHYDLSPAWAYKDALWDEPRRMETATFAEIATAKAPADFHELFAADFTTWLELRRKEQTTKPLETTEDETNVSIA